MLLIKNIGMLVGCYSASPMLKCGQEMNAVGQLPDAWVLVDEGKVKIYGSMSDPNRPSEDCCRQVVDACGGWLMPTFCDSHTHIVYAGSRDGEFRDKIAGLSYEEIARRGGGILNSSDLLNATSEDELYSQSARRLQQCVQMGTGAIEIKSGYGLSVEGELKMLRVIRRLKENFPQLEIRSTFLGAHAIGRKYTGRQSDYVDMLVYELLPRVVEENLADYIDVFCDTGFFTVEETDRILKAGSKHGIRGKIHANELAVSGGVQVGIANKALSVDHLERITAVEIEALRQRMDAAIAAGETPTIPTMLPGASFFLGIPYGDARGIINGGLPLALASDYNPGSSPSGSMRFVMSLGCIKMKLTPEEAFNAVTVNAAAALGVADKFGAIFPGVTASMILLEPLPSLAYLPYAYTEKLIRRIFFRGKSL